MKKFDLEVQEKSKLWLLLQLNNLDWQLTHEDYSITEEASVLLKTCSYEPRKCQLIFSSALFFDIFEYTFPWHQPGRVQHHFQRGASTQTEDHIQKLYLLLQAGQMFQVFQQSNQEPYMKFIWGQVNIFCWWEW